MSDAFTTIIVDLETPAFCVYGLELGLWLDVNGGDVRYGDAGELELVAIEEVELDDTLYSWAEFHRAHPSIAHAAALAAIERVEDDAELALEMTEQAHERAVDDDADHRMECARERRASGL